MFNPTQIEAFMSDELTDLPRATELNASSKGLETENDYSTETLNSC